MAGSPHHREGKTEARGAVLPHTGLGATCKSGSARETQQGPFRLGSATTSSHDHAHHENGKAVFKKVLFGFIHI